MAHFLTLLGIESGAREMKTKGSSANLCPSPTLITNRVLSFFSENTCSTAFPPGVKSSKKHTRECVGSF